MQVRDSHKRYSKEHSRSKSIIDAFDPVTIGQAGRRNYSGPYRKPAEMKQKACMTNVKK